jgi:hypothetical protein
VTLFGAIAADTASSKCLGEIVNTVRDDAGKSAPPCEPASKIETANPRFAADRIGGHPRRKPARIDRFIAELVPAEGIEPSTY